MCELSWAGLLGFIHKLHFREITATYRLDWELKWKEKDAFTNYIGLMWTYLQLAHLSRAFQTSEVLLCFFGNWIKNQNLSWSHYILSRLASVPPAPVTQCSHSSSISFHILRQVNIHYSSCHNKFKPLRFLKSCCF